MKEKTKNKRAGRVPLTVSTSIGCFLIFMILGGLLTYASYRVAKTVLYNRYKAQMTSIVDLAYAHIDIDDMSECSKTFVESEKYKETSAYFDNFVTNYSDLHYLYILKVGDDGNVYSICSANSDYEKENEPDMVLHLGETSSDWYSEEVTNTLAEITKGNEDIFFLQPSEWGVDYTLARPLIDSSGDHYALLCVDIDTAAIKQTLRTTSLVTGGIVLGVALVFTALLIQWMYFFTIKPIKKLKNSVIELADKTNDSKDPTELEFKAPATHGILEVQELSNAVEKMTNDIRNYILNITEQEKEVAHLHESIEEMDVVAYQDALTGVKNKAAYDRDAKLLSEKIKNKEDVKFAIVMIDVNDLKGINDTFGHDSGDIYIKGSCAIACEIFKKSPVYRVGGDEIAIILQGEDYENRFDLVDEAKEEYRKSLENEEVEKFRRFSAAVGIATFDKNHDEEIESVFRRADKAMYQNKTAIKGK